ncbi:hypothetical protein PIB30_059764 [Stylosanthes scabra]|uniref:Uncharacterized protein n=1 Tax=Stylosanthes scabra TaxID=79078 RepID=A0ABU6QK04_9FABA|nr:hypothetical protein [Stylosanthes scabra]
MLMHQRSIKRGVLEVDTVDAILAQNRTMAQQLSAMNKKLEKLEDVHTSVEQVNYVGNQPRNDPYSNTYNQGWKNHPNFSWGGNQGSNNRPYQLPFQRQQQYQPLTSTPQ